MIEVRKATIHDVSCIVDFNLAMAWESEKLKLDAQILRAGVTAVIEERAPGFYLMANDSASSQVVGSLLVQYEWSDWRNGNFYWIHSVYVIPSARGQGVFKALYNEVEKIGNREEGFRGLRLYVEKDNSNARQVYEKLGMKESYYRIYSSKIVSATARMSASRGNG